MNSLRLAILLSLVLAATRATADSYAITILTEKGVSITAPQKWSRRLADAGIANVRIRSARSGEQADIEEVEAGRSRVYRVTGVLTRRDRLRLPGASFTLQETAELRDYLDALLADGADAMTAERGRFGLTKKQFEKVFQSLGRPIEFETKDKPIAALLSEVKKRAGMEVDLASGLGATVSRLRCLDDLRSLSLGCGLSVALKAHGIAATPEKPRGKPVRLSVRFAREVEEPWPIGWPNKASPSDVAPTLFKRINVEIDGFTLAEAVAAIGPRLEMPFLWDHAMLDAKRIDPEEVQVKLERGNMTYKRILDKLLFQARLRGEIRTDEAGTPFYWVSR